MPEIYSSNDLKVLVRILNAILAEARLRQPDLSKDDIVARFFTLADNGERDAKKLHAAVFGKRSRGMGGKLKIADLGKAMRVTASTRRPSWA